MDGFTLWYMSDRIVPKGEVGAVGAMRSTLAWALLGLVIERPSYGYELMQRFRRVYGDTLALSGHGRIYTAIETLRVHSLIEELDEDPAKSRLTRHPRPRYRATPEGVGAYQEWLLAQATEERQRERILVQQLAMLEPQTALEVIDGYKRACLEETAQLRAGAEASAEPATTAAEVAERLADEHDRLAFEARLTWIEYARQEFSDLSEGDGEER
jgi:DNA-binding PadR family transcriptional regulator